MNQTSDLVEYIILVMLIAAGVVTLAQVVAG